MSKNCWLDEALAPYCLYNSTVITGTKIKLYFTTKAYAAPNKDIHWYMACEPCDPCKISEELREKMPIWTPDDATAEAFGRADNSQITREVLRHLAMTDEELSQNCGRWPSPPVFYRRRLLKMLNECLFGWYDMALL